VSRSPAHPGPSDPIIIGLAGGIGSGKSTLAQALGSLGFLVIDFDAEVRGLLNQPDVQETLRSWWGEAVIAQDGSTDRAKVSQIVFDSAEDRRRLESLIHPRLMRGREDLLRQARAASARGVVLDAPLLFESGLDRACDAVIFVEAPEALRRARAAGRGWGPDEVSRRESVQLPIEEKRRRSGYIFNNEGTPADLLDQARRIVATLERAGGASPTA